MTTALCYQCQYRSDVPGSAHSRCKHPAFAATLDDPLANVLSIFASVGRGVPVQAVSEECRVIGHPHGIQRGWFNHPYDFDPVWLQECNGFVSKAST